MNGLKKAQTQQKGFTIIEVVLVLAIAGLIFLMVFIALPALQRNQRDTQRKTDMGRLETAIVNYSGSARGALPANATAWTAFEKSYLTTDGDTFIDPAGAKDTEEMYKLVPTSKSPLDETFATAQNTIYYSTSAVCGDDAASIKSAGSRKVAFRMVLEGGGYYCSNN